MTNPLQGVILSAAKDLMYSLKTNVSNAYLPGNERYPSTGGKLYVRDSIWIPPPIHIACDHVAVPKNPFYYGYVACTIGALYPGLEVYNGPNGWSGGNMPTELSSTSCPLPGISIGPPWHKYAMQLVVTLIGPPGAARVGEGITGGIACGL